MGFWTSKPVEAEVPPATIVSSAAQVNLASKKNALRDKNRTEKWQEDAWYFFDTVGEYASGCRWVGNLLSRARLYPTFDDGNGPVAVTEGPAYEYMDSFGGNEDGRSQIIREFGVHYTVAGECYLVLHEDPDTGEDAWVVVAKRSLKRVDDSTYEVNGVTMKVSMVIRTWEPHPTTPKKATSPSRAALPVLSQLQRLTMMADAQIDSRLAGAGLLLLPNSAVFAAGGKEASADEFMEKLTTAMATAVSDRGDSSSLVPIVITADADALEKIRHLTLDTPIDEQIGDMVDRAIRRVGLALDMPPEILTGQGDSNHWTAWAIDESAIKSHTEPLLRRIALDIARGYLHPLLKAKGVEDWWRYSVGVDTSEMRLRPNRSKEAFELYDRGELSGKALLRETGFEETDAPDKAEKILWLLNKVAGGSTTPELVHAALVALGVNLPAPTDDGDTQEERPSRSLEEHPEQNPPDEEDSQAASLVAACEQLVFRALERAGNRLKTMAGIKTTRGVDACDLYRTIEIDRARADDLLLDAWSKTPRYLAHHDVDPEAASAALDTYVRLLMTNGQTHTRAALARHLADLPRRAQIGHP